MHETVLLNENFLGKKIIKICCKTQVSASQIQTTII